MQIKPLGERVLVKVDKPETKTVGGIVLAEGTINPTFFKGEVVALGPQYAFMELGAILNIGDRVAFLKYGYEDMGDDMYIVEPQSLIAIITE